jgi:hypothetical protein
MKDVLMAVLAELVILGIVVLAGCHDTGWRCAESHPEIVVQWILIDDGHGSFHQIPLWETRTHCDRWVCGRGDGAESACEGKP